MAIEFRDGRPSPYRVYWNNPFTRKREHASFSSLPEAKKYDSLIKHRLKHEKEFFRPKDEEPESSAITVREAIAQYLAHSKMSPSNMEVTLHHLKSLILFLGKIEVTSISRKHLIQFMHTEAQSGIKALTAHRRLSILRSALSWALEFGLIESNPLAGIKIAKGRAERIAPPSLAELDSLMAAAPNHLQRVLLLSVSLGVRVGESELLSMMWEDVDLKRGLVRVWSADKNPSRPYRDIPLRTDLAAALEVWAQEDAATGAKTLINFKGKPVKSIKTAWKTCKRNAGIVRRLRPYDLRHAFATYALDGGADIKAVADNMGHSDPSMILKHYQHGKEETRRIAVESIPNLPKYVPKICPQQKRTHGVNRKSLIFMVGMRGFEPPAPASRTQCSTRLSHIPKRLCPFGPVRRTENYTSLFFLARGIWGAVQHIPHHTHNG